jgi:hypothetical protein
LFLLTQASECLPSLIDGISNSAGNVAGSVSSGSLCIQIKRVTDRFIDCICGLVAWCRCAKIVAHVAGEVLNRRCLSLELAGVPPHVSNTTEDVLCIITCTANRIRAVACNRAHLLSQVSNDISLGSLLLDC